MTTFLLKIIAFTTMFIDHLGCCLGDTGIISGSSTLYLTLRTIGRIAFPIFAFQLAKGAAFTRNKWKYALRLLIFAFIAEIPFDLAIFAQPIYFYYQNVLFTLLLGLLCIYVMMWGSRLEGKKKILGWALTIIAVIAAMVLATMLYTDYDAAGVLMIVVMGLPNAELKFVRKWIPNEKILELMCCAIGIAACSYMCGGLEWYAMFALIPIYFFNGERGYYNKYVKWAEYAFYPVHLLILAAIFTIPHMF